MNKMAVFVSGRGSNLHALLDQEGCNIRLVCSHKWRLPADSKAKRHFIPVFKTKKVDFNEWKQFLKSRHISRIFLLGFMRIVPAEFIEAWKNKMVNLHPSLLPSYAGLQAIEKSFADKAPMGVSVHAVIPQMDAGLLLARSRVFSVETIPSELTTASLMMTFREHFLVRRMGEKWN